MTTDTDDASHLPAVWGDVFEVAVKRGFLAELLDRGLVDARTPGLAEWSDGSVAGIRRTVREQYPTAAGNVLSRASKYTGHLLAVGGFLGRTVARAWADKRVDDGSAIEAVWCPLSLPDRLSGETGSDGRDLLAEFAAVTGLEAPNAEMAKAGGAARADFLIVGRTRKGKRFLLCVEFSHHAPEDPGDMGRGDAHLAEVRGFVGRLESRGVFSRLSADVTDGGFELNRRVVSHLPALTTSDKPLYKLMQGASYACGFVDAAGHAEPIDVDVAAVTPAGVESASGTFASEAGDLRADLLRELGRAYRNHRQTTEREKSRAELHEEARLLFRQVARGLPAALAREFRENLENPPIGGGFTFRATEALSYFRNPSTLLPREDALDMIVGNEAVGDLLGGAPRERVGAFLASGDPTLRDVHAAAIRAAVDALPVGEMRCLSLGGHPGVGKTTALVEQLRAMAAETGGGFLCLYASPRIVINSDVTSKFSRRDGEPTGVFSLTSNASLIRGAYDRAVANGERPARQGFGAVVHDGLTDFRPPASGIKFLTPDDAETIEAEHGSRGLRRERDDLHNYTLASEGFSGVLRTLARAARASSGADPAPDKVVLTAAIQGYRELEGKKNTIDGLDELFAHAPSKPKGIRERREMAKRTPTIVVMVDELAGDSAGVAMIHALADWLRRQFIHPFEDAGETPPFRIMMILSDASLGNPDVMESFLAHQEGSPEKVLLSGSSGPRAFDLESRPLKVGARMTPTLHVMADAYPANNLDLEYCISLSTIERRLTDSGEPEPVKKAIEREAGDAMMDVAIEEIGRACNDLGPDEQVVFFAQDKGFLSDLRKQLTAGDDGKPRVPGLGGDDVAILDSATYPKDRKQLVEPETRDRKRVFLMTSSGARGVSFPLATRIVAFVPRFAVETGLMEIAQLIFRGRGGTTLDGRKIDGDKLDRRLSLVLTDFVLRTPSETDAEIDRRWIRQAIDLTCFSVLLRSTIMTRISGDADVPSRRLAVVPVGRTGADEMEETVAGAVRELHEECRAVRNRAGDALSGTLTRIMEVTERLFSGYTLAARLKNRGGGSVGEPSALDRALMETSADSAPLLGRDVARPPGRAVAFGPLLMEPLDHAETREVMHFETWRERHRRDLENMRGLLDAVTNEAAAPDRLRGAARDVRRMLGYDDDALRVAHDVGKGLNASNLWLAVPADHRRFTRPTRTDLAEGRDRRLEDPLDWMSALVRSASTTQTGLDFGPILPTYESMPFLAFLATTDPTDTARLFDARYFLASKEFNLLNAIVLGGE